MTALLLAWTFGTGGVPPTSSTAQPAASSPRRLTLERLVDPATRVEIDGRVVPVTLHGFLKFESLADLFAFIDAETGRWRFDTAAERQAFGDDLLRRGVQSRIVSMETERPLEVLLTHTHQDLVAALGRVRTPAAPAIFAGRHWRLDAVTYRAAFEKARDRWSRSLNCWSASPSMAARVLSNWFVIDEGIELYGARYDSTEHFWQAVKYHPDVTIGDLSTLVGELGRVDWPRWLAALERDQRFFFDHAYAMYFLRHHLRVERFDWFAAELASAGRPDERARAAQQRARRDGSEPLRFTPLQEKVLWGDLADVLHLVVTFSARLEGALPDEVVRLKARLVALHFDAIHLPGYAGGRFPFLSREFQDLMFEIWKVKYLEMPRFGEVIRSTAGRRLDHFLDDGDSPDIPIPVYVDQLNRIRDLAFTASRR